MNKLEQAIRKTAREGQLQNSTLNNTGSSCIEEINKMETSYLFDEKTLKNKKIIYPGFKNSELINSFRELRTAISSDYGKNLIMVTSMSSKAGTSFFARNLAAAMSFDVTKTSLLLDCNLLTKTDLSKTFEIEDKPGISDYISNSQLSIESIIYESGIKRLRVVPFGGSGNSFDEHFSHPRFYNLIGQVKNKYQERNIIIDAPPILNSADSRILLGLCDQVVLVVPYGKGGQEQIDTAARLIGREKLTGVVFNDYIR